MNNFVVCLGSNVSEASDMIAKAVEALKAEGCVLISCSDVYQVSAPYYNFVARFSTSLDYPTLHALTKDIERRLGRTPDLKSLGMVPIDIDIVLFNSRVRRPSDYRAPYFQPGYLSVKCRE